MEHGAWARSRDSPPRPSHPSRKGGATKAGVKNAVMLFSVDEEGLVPTLQSEHVFGKQEDGVMSLAVHPKVREESRSLPP